MWPGHPPARSHRHKRTDACAIIGVAALGLAVALTVVLLRAGSGAGSEAAARSPARRDASRRGPHAISVVRAAAVGREVSVWLPYWSMAAAYDSAIANAGVVGTASPFWYTISGDSRIEDDSGAGDPSVIGGLHARGIKVIPTVTESDDMQEFDRLLASPPRRSAMVRALVTIARSRDYNGVNLDFEEFALDRAHRAGPADKAAALYPAFVGDVCRALHTIDRSCTVTVMARTSAARVYWRNKLATWVYDYSALAEVADRVQIMAYDEHAPGTAPGPVAPFPWVEQVVHYTSATMPVDKVDLALAAYGYDWSRGQTSPITSRQAAELVVQTGASPSWNASQAEETFHYTSHRRRYTVWYENARANYDRAILAKAAGFAGVEVWYAGAEDPAVWPLLRGLYAR
jgi:spore germination protein